MSVQSCPGKCCVQIGRIAYYIVDKVQALAKAFFEKVSIAIIDKISAWMKDWIQLVLDEPLQALLIGGAVGGVIYYEPSRNVLLYVGKIALTVWGIAALVFCVSSLVKAGLELVLPDNKA